MAKEIEAQKANEILCVCCGEKIPQFLTIDHIKNDGYGRRIAGEQCGAGLYKQLESMGWPKDEYQLLCMNCNFAKGHFGTCPHTHMVDKSNG